MGAGKKLLVACFLIMAVFLSSQVVTAEVDCSNLAGEPLYSCLGRQIDELQKSLEMSKAATAPLEQEVAKIQTRLKSTQRQLSAAKIKQVVLEGDIGRREKLLTGQVVVFGNKMRDFYKAWRSEVPLVLLFTGSAKGERGLAYRQAASNNDRKIVLELSSQIVRLESDKKKVEEEGKQLAKLQQQMDSQADELGKIIKGAKDFQASLSSKIAQLSSRQKEVLASKNETFQTTVGDVPLADDPNSRPDFNPGFSPAFAAFSFGAAHFKGMSQYGAFGRAKAGQGVEEILRAYYGSGIEIKKDYSTSINIRVNGYGTVDLETYAKRIYEMPGSWGDQGGFEALKAQAVAARSYALAYTNNGAGTICATESCQVYKPSNKGGKWEEAVNATRGWVLVAGGKPFSAWYSSTSGGYLQSYTSNSYSTIGFWDTPVGRSGWTGQAYEKQAGSPWFYKGWYKTRSGDTCGRSHPWLTSEEMADVLNAWVVVVKNGKSDERVLPLGSCWGGNPYSMSELKDKGGFERVSSVSVSYSDGGYTSSVHLETNKGGLDISGAEFKQAFNLRAPGRVSIKSGLFNIEKK